MSPHPPIMRLCKEGDTVDSRVRLGLTKHGLLDTSKLAVCPIAEKNRNASPLLRLPAELRNTVFTMILQKPCLQIRDFVVLTLTADIILRTKICYGGLNKALVKDKEAESYPLLSLVCRQMYDETCLLPYALNSFGFTSMNALRIWTSSRLPIQLRQIKVLKTPISFERAYFEQSSCRFTDLFPHLEVLYVDLWNARFSCEMNGWSADQIEQDIQERTKVLLQRERSGLKIVVTEYRHIGVAGTNFLHEV